MSLTEKGLRRHLAVLESGQAEEGEPLGYRGQG
jgi:hypothetical protein